MPLPYMPFYKRRLLLDFKLQSMLFLFTICVVVLTSIVNFLSMRSANLENQALLGHPLSSNFALDAVIFMTFFLILFGIILISHSIAGPIYRLNDQMRRTVEGEELPKIKFRKFDQFHSLAENYNNVIFSLRSRDLPK